MSHHPQPRRRPARGQLRHPRAPRPASSTAAARSRSWSSRSRDWAHELGLEPIFFQTNHEGEFVEYLHRLPDLADARADQRRRLDPLQPRDRRRARRRRAARGRGPPLRRREPRGLAQGLGLRRPGPGEDLRQGRRRLPRGAELLARELGARGLMRGRGDRLEALLAERELDRMLVTDLTNVRYLTGFTGTNGACDLRPRRPHLPHRLPLHRARRRRGRGLGADHGHRRLAGRDRRAARGQGRLRGRPRCRCAAWRN